jgi:predicted metal-dependent phosphoesterase TrpH
LGLFLEKEVPPNLSIRETCKRIRAQGGITVAAHPFNYDRINGGKITVDDGIGMVNLIKEKRYLDAIEVVNATPTRTDENLSSWFVNSTLLFKAEFGGSDAHILDAIGVGRTLFEGKTAEDLKEALLHNQTKAIKERWRMLALLRYAYFFIPIGIRLLSYTLLHGRRPKRPEMIDV